MRDGIKREKQPVGKPKRHPGPPTSLAMWRACRPHEGHTKGDNQNRRSGLLKHPIVRVVPGVMSIAQFLGRFWAVSVQLPGSSQVLYPLSQAICSTISEHHKKRADCNDLMNAFWQCEEESCGGNRPCNVDAAACMVVRQHFAPLRAAVPLHIWHQP